MDHQRRMLKMMSRLMSALEGMQMMVLNGDMMSSIHALEMISKRNDWDCRYYRDGKYIITKDRETADVKNLFVRIDENGTCKWHNGNMPFKVKGDEVSGNEDSNLERMLKFS